MEVSFIHPSLAGGNRIPGWSRRKCIWGAHRQEDLRHCGRVMGAKTKAAPGRRSQLCLAMEEVRLRGRKPQPVLATPRRTRAWKGCAGTRTSAVSWSRWAHPANFVSVVWPVSGAARAPERGPEWLLWTEEEPARPGPLLSLAVSLALGRGKRPFRLTDVFPDSSRVCAGPSSSPILSCVFRASCLLPPDPLSRLSQAALTCF